MKDITLCIVTYNSPEVLWNMVMSLHTYTNFLGRVMVVNNGDPVELSGAEVFNTGQNLGWEGGVNYGLEKADTRYFVMANDDLLFVPGSENFWWNFRTEFDLHRDLGGVGPSSNYISGGQSAYYFDKHNTLELGYLIGMMAMYPTSLLKDLGGLDTSLPGGDDLDLSIRMRSKGHKLMAVRRNYVHHVGGQTGRRVHGEKWDSHEHQTATMNALVRKHGLKKWYEMVTFTPREVTLT